MHVPLFGPLSLKEYAIYIINLCHLFINKFVDGLAIGLGPRKLWILLAKSHGQIGKEVISESRRAEIA